MTKPKFTQELCEEMYKELFRLSVLFRKNSIYLDEREKIENILRKARGGNEVSK